jgi:hypothetical protein
VISRSLFLFQIVIVTFVAINFLFNMRATLLFFFIFISVADSFSQNRNSVWCFGDSAGIDFSSGVPVTFATGMDGRGSCSSIADTSGNLLFYAFTDGYSNGDWSTRVFNRQHYSMPSADSITGAAWYNELVIINKPRSNHEYYLFSVGLDSPNNQGLFYSLVDMNADGGLGDVVQENIQINSNRNADCIHAIKHGNGRDWWIISKYSSPIAPNQYNRFYIYLVTSDSIYSPIILDFNDATDSDFQKIIFNSNGTKFMLLNISGFMCEYEFDRCTGIINNPNVIYPDIIIPPFNRQFWEGAYSPNDQIFYATTTNYNGNPKKYLLQFDLTASNIALSCDTINWWKAPKGPGSVRLAPDGRIYLSRAYESLSVWSFPYADTMYNNINMNLSVINYPDSLGTACDFQNFSFNLGGKRTYYGLPNNPNYDLGPLTGSPCDTLTGISLTPVLPEGAGALYVYYNPVWQKAFINAKGLRGRNVRMSVYDLLGNVVYAEENLTPALSSGEGGGYFTKDLNCAAFAKGMYIVSLETDKERLVKKFIKD